MFVVSAIGGVIVIVTAFVFFPIAKMLFAAFITDEGSYSILVFFDKFFDGRIWGLGCLAGARCGAAWNSLFLAVLVGLDHDPSGTGFRACRHALRDSATSA